MAYTEPDPWCVDPAPEGPTDPLGASVLDPALPPLRVFACPDLRVVLGRHQQVAQEVHIEACRTDGVPINRRPTGGGTVVLAPGAMVLALRFATAGDPDPRHHLDRLGGVIAEAVAAAGCPRPQVIGSGDLALPGGPAGPRKILGASLRQSRGTGYYLASLLVADLTALMARYLAPPSRQPDYRAARDHTGFCTHLGAWTSPAALEPILLAALEPLARA